MTAFTMLPITVNNDKLPVLDPDSYEPFGIIETNSLRHWILGRDAGLVDLKKQKALAPYVNPPLLKSNHIVAGSDYATSTGIYDDVNQTLVVVFQMPDGLSTTPLCSYETPIQTGVGVLTSSTNSIVMINKRSGGTVNESYPAVPGQWYFAAISVSLTETKVSIPALSIERTFSVNTPGTTGYVINVGGRSGGGFSGLGNVAEAIVFDKALSLSEITKLYNRSKSRMADRGVII
ncbi:hypothetical protein [Idiomarina abyssalis]|uniref:hypothetical protein n=1 Tax=Idiomarina abyssalis TaxID=86102 RepID=UPI003A8F2467